VLDLLHIGLAPPLSSRDGDADDEGDNDADGDDSFGARDLRSSPMASARRSSGGASSGGLTSGAASSADAASPLGSSIAATPQLRSGDSGDDECCLGSDGGAECLLGTLLSPTPLDTGAERTRRLLAARVDALARSHAKSSSAALATAAAVSGEERFGIRPLLVVVRSRSSYH
jgi:hypothetical protein